MLFEPLNCSFPYSLRNIAGLAGGLARKPFGIVGGEMKKPDIARQLARRSRVSQAEAADRLDLVLHKILSDLRKGKEAALPGLGRLKHGPDGRVAFEREADKSHG